MAESNENLDRILRRADAADYMGVSIATIDGWVQTGRLVRPIRLSPAAVGWRLSTLDEFIRQAQNVPYNPDRRGRKPKTPRA